METYTQLSEPKLTGGKWIFNSYDIVPIRAIADVTIIKNDTVCINSFDEQSYTNKGILMKQNYQSTPIDRRFIIGFTKWEFDDNNYSLYCDFSNGGSTPLHPRFPVTFSNYMMSEYDKMTVDNTKVGCSTTYTFETNTTGANYPTKLILLSPEIVTNLYLSDGRRDKAVSVRILLKFMR